MDCEEVKELLDAYSLGAAEKAEAQGLEEHVADCVRCWEELNEAQRTAAMLALSVAIEEAPASLRHRILAQAGREARPGRSLSDIWQVLRGRWLAAATGVLAAVGVSALALAAVVQVELNGLQDENSELERRVQAADSLLGEQRQMLAVLSAVDAQEVRIAPTGPGTQASGVYRWSPANGKGFVTCNKLPLLEEDRVYQVWFFMNGEPVPAGTFTSQDGYGQIATDIRLLAAPPDAIGISIEAAGGSERPTADMFLYASLPPE